MAELEQTTVEAFNLIFRTLLTRGKLVRWVRSTLSQSHHISIGTKCADPKRPGWRLTRQASRTVSLPSTYGSVSASQVLSRPFSTSTRSGREGARSIHPRESVISDPHQPRGSIRSDGGLTGRSRAFRTVSGCHDADILTRCRVEQIFELILNAQVQKPPQQHVRAIRLRIGHPLRAGQPNDR